MTGTDTSQFFREISIVSVSDTPGDGHSLDIELIRPCATPDQPARIRITAHNESADEWRFKTGYREVFGSFDSVTTDPGLLLEYPQTGIKMSDQPLRPLDEDIYYDSIEPITHLQPGQTGSVDFIIYDSPNNTGESFVPGEYRFQHHYEVIEFNREIINEFDWGFTLSVS